MIKTVYNYNLVDVKIMKIFVHRPSLYKEHFTDKIDQ